MLETDASRLKDLKYGSKRILTAWVEHDSAEEDFVVATRYTDDTAASAAQATADTAQAGVSDLTTTIQTALEETEESILATVTAQYAKTDDLITLEATLSSQLAVMADGISMNFSQQAQTIDSISDDLIADQMLRQTYIRFTASGIELGKLDSPFKTVIDNTHLGFLQDGDEVASVSNSRMYITTAEVRSTFTLGATNLGQYDLYQKSNGNLSLKYRGAA